MTHVAPSEVSTDAAEGESAAVQAGVKSSLLCRLPSQADHWRAEADRLRGALAAERAAHAAECLAHAATRDALIAARSVAAPTAPTRHPVVVAIHRAAKRVPGSAFGAS